MIVSVTAPQQKLGPIVLSGLMRGMTGLGEGEDEELQSLIESGGTGNGSGNGTINTSNPDFSTTVTTDTRGFLQGIQKWLNPAQAFISLNQVAMGQDTPPITYTIGLTVPPVVLVGLILILLKRRR